MNSLWTTYGPPMHARIRTHQHTHHAHTKAYTRGPLWTTYGLLWTPLWTPYEPPMGVQRGSIVGYMGLYEAILGLCLD